VSRRFSFGPDAVVARSLGMTRSTHILVAALTMAVTANATVAMQFINFSGQSALLAVLFISMAVVASAVSTDVLARSSQTVGNLKSLGATKGKVSGVVLFSVLAYGVVGTALGSGLGGALGFVIGNFSGVATGLIAQSMTVFVVAAVATATGAYAGTKFTWRS
jgi:predicted lysophospholipase L1 biosynthesis ABC-type transport system permease subunit